MDTISNPIWRLTFIIIIIAAESYTLDCKNFIDKTQKCFCVSGEATDIQCPKTEPIINLSVSRKNNIKLQCLQNAPPFIDLDLIPDVNLSESKVFRMEYCYLNTSFMDFLNKFKVQNLTTLSFESMVRSENDANITLTKESFQSLQGLESLTLSYSTFFLSEDFLANTPNLLVLMLSKSLMPELKRYFKYVPKLVILEITENGINVLPEGIFEDLSNLSRLSLFKNKITTISRKSFNGLKNLQLLELSNNYIEELPEDTFADLPKLVNISLRANRIRQTHSNIFRNNSMLQNIRLGVNKGIILSDYLFADLKVLRTVELFFSEIKTVPDNIFKNCEKLETIYLQNNMLETLPEGLFAGLKALKELNLSYNKLSSLPNEIFSSLENLLELKLRNNALSVISETLFHHLGHLKVLDLQRNLISVIAPNAFTDLSTSLTYLDISFNKWDNNYKFPAATPLSNLVQLEQLILNHNEMDSIPDLPSLLKLKKMDLGFNQISDLPVVDYAHSVAFTFDIDLSHNKIEHVDFHLAEILSRENNHDGTINESVKSDSINLKITNNPIVCDCLNYELIRYNNNEMKILKKFVNIKQDGLSCSNANDTKVTDLKPWHIYCPVIRGCPDSCTCSYKPYNTSVIVDCSFNNLTSYPELAIPSKGPHVYNQTVLILSGNKLTKGPSGNEENYSNITILNLSQNLITEVDWIPPQIKEINLNDNSIKNLDKHFINQLNKSSLEHLYLKGNPWECNCKSSDLQNYLMKHYQKVNTSDVKCTNSGVELTKLANICKISPYLSILLPILLAVLLCFAVVVAIYYRYQTEIKIYLFAKNMCLWFVTEEELDKDKTYDVFISYSHQDEKFVEQLVRELEYGEKPFKVCIHVRDWIPGQFITEQIVNSVNDSRRTLVVLSNNFLDSIWGKMEFRAAHTQAIKEGRARVVVVLYGDIDENNVDDELKSYLNTNTYVKWGDKYFWNKLRYALPHSSKGFYERNKKHAKTMLKIDDKFDLIKNPPSPSITSTPPITLDPSLLKEHEIKFDMTKKIEGESPLLFKS